MRLFLNKKKRKEGEKETKSKKENMMYIKNEKKNSLPELSIGIVHNIGKRASQQDNLGYINVEKGIFAVVADGMGGLTNSERVSQNAVNMMIGFCRNLNAEQIRNNLPVFITQVNSEINRMLGPEGIYKSGSTLVCAYAEPDQLRWISIGDSRIYLYRSGSLLQLNREHVYETELILHSVNGKISMRDVRENKQKKHVTSFIGMGEIKHIDYNLTPVPVQRDDCIVLSSDGVFNTLSDLEISAIIQESSNARACAEAIEKAVLKKENPYQDNFSLVVIYYA